MALQPYQEESEVTNPVKRIRWATHRANGAKAANKRHSLKERLHKRIGSGSQEKKRDSLGKETGKETGPFEGGDLESSDAGTEEQDSGRRVYFNTPLPPNERDDEGHPIHQYARNKIRTARYTPLSFIPKNLYLQFHNIANIYFLFIIILGVRTCAIRSRFLR
jgi:phospholipid-translocating ATPase